VYTFKGGIKTIIWTDSFQTIFLISSVAICVVLICGRLDLDFSSLISTIMESKYSKTFYFDDINSKLFFPKQFFGGAFLAIAMTGLDQDLMQKNLTCKNIGEAQKNMFWFTIILVFVNLLFLTLGALLYIYSAQKGIPLPASSDDLFPSLALHEFGTFAGIFFLLGIIASSYASADSAMTALTTSFCIDFLNFKDKNEIQKQQQKFRVHIGVSLVFLIIIIIFRELNDRSLIDTVLTVAAYTYGPLLGMYSFGLFTKIKIKDQFVPFICVLSPVITFIINYYSKTWLNGYEFGYELLILNGLITYLCLLLIQDKKA
jgi:Na+/proline symporter